MRLRAKRTTSPRTLMTELLAMLLIGSGVIRLMTPRRHAMRWAMGPLEGPADWARERPMMMRGTGVVRLLLGLWLVRKLPAR